MDYKEYNDNELLSYIAENNEDATEILYKKYMPLVTKIARKMYAYTSKNGIEVNDLVQEGMLGLSSAIHEYDEQKNASFYTFAKTCIERKIISAVTATRRLKHKLLNDSLPLEIHGSENSILLEEIIGDNKKNPESMLLDSENFNEIVELVRKELTDFEIQVFDLRMSEFGYKEIAEILDRDIKAIDNCLQRIKAKVKRVVTSSNM